MPLKAASFALLALGLPFAAYNGVGSPPEPLKVAAAAPAVSSPSAAVAKVWLVEERAGSEFYSNGLRIERQLEVSTKPRHYRALQRASGTWVERTAPAGILFHTTESWLAPFNADHNNAIKEAGTGILSYVRGRELYHFVIDRFGRVFRLVVESDVAYHAGHSVWADEQLTYLDLNNSFLAVSFEAQTEKAVPSWTAAQANAAKLLTEMLRGKYGISAANCATHAQVSVNPRNMLLGYHTDWAASFPFRELGLRDGYQEPIPAVALFGFGYGGDFLTALGGQPWPGLVLAEQQLVKDAAAAGQTPGTWRRMLREKYRKTAEAARINTAGRERTRDES